MAFPTFLPALILAQTVLLFLSIQTTPTPAPSSSKPLVSNSSILFTEYITGKSVKFSDIPVNPNVEFHFILSFAVDYTISSNSLFPANGKFEIFWDTNNLSPMNVLRMKVSHQNIKFALSLGGDRVGNIFLPKPSFVVDSVDSWVNNVVSSLTRIIKKYRLDGIDIDYQHFYTDSDTFAECIGQLIIYLKNNGVISFASIAPFDDSKVQSHYQALWRRYGSVIDYVNLQFYGYDKITNVSQFLLYFDQQRLIYEGGQILMSFTSDQSRGLSVENGFFGACDELKKEGKFGGIFIRCSDLSWENGFQYEKQAQVYLGSG